MAQEVPMQGTATPTVITQLTVLASLAVLPFAVMLLTSFVKIIVVLSLLRQALGVQNSPPNQVLIGIALLMTVYVAYPTGLAMYNAGGDFIHKNAPQELLTGPTASYIIEGGRQGERTSAGVSATQYHWKTPQ